MYYLQKLYAVAGPRMRSVRQLPHTDVAILLPWGAALAKFIGVACPNAKFCCRMRNSVDRRGPGRSAATRTTIRAIESPLKMYIIIFKPREGTVAQSKGSVPFLRPGYVRRGWPIFQIWKVNPVLTVRSYPGKLTPPLLYIVVLEPRGVLKRSI